MTSHPFPALDSITDPANSADWTEVPEASDDFGMYVVRLLRTDSPEAADDSVLRPHLASIEAGSVKATPSTHSAGDGQTVPLPDLSTHDSPAISFDSNIGMAGLLQSASDSSLIFIGADAFAKSGQGGGGTGGGGTTIPNYISGTPGHYNIEIIFTGTWSTDLANVFKTAANLLSQYITTDIPDVLYRGQIIDDLQITASLSNIDGVGGVLGQAGPTAIRTGSYLPAVGSMQFDIADANTYQKQGLFDDIVLHEMMHTLGFGTVWSYKGLLNGAGGANPLFTGSKALSAYQTLFNAAGATGVPVEQDGGSGTRDSHWDEQTFNGELMTGYIGYKDSNGNSVLHDNLSYMSVASLGDLGYTLDPTMNAGNFTSPGWIV